MKQGVAVCLLLCAVTLAQAFRILGPIDAFQQRQPRIRPLQNVATADLIPQTYPAHDDFLKQLITYLESVGRKR